MKFNLLLWAIVLNIPFSYANCVITSNKVFFEKIKENHPKLIHNETNIKSIGSQIDIAKEVPNPMLRTTLEKGEEFEGDLERASLSYLHTFELGSKRDARIKYAKSSLEQAEYYYQNKSEDVFIDAIVKSHRLRQTLELIPLYEEAISTLQKIYQKKKRIKSLSPEQQVQQETLVLAINDYELKKVQLISERINLKKHLSFYIGKNCTFKKEALPRSIDLKKGFSGVDKIDRFSRLNEAKKMLDMAKDKLKLEESKVYPNLQIGPLVQTAQVSGKRLHSYGLSLQMRLPLLNTNAGERVKSHINIHRARHHLESVQRESELDLDSAIQKYNSLKKALDSITNQKELNQKHKKIEKLFARGVVSISMVLESHRQLIEYYKTRFKFEIQAVKAVWNIYKYQGKVLEVNTGEKL